MRGKKVIDGDLLLALQPATSTNSGRWLMPDRSRVLAALLATQLGWVCQYGPVNAAAAVTTPETVCAVARLKGARAYARSVLECYAKAAAKDLPPADMASCVQAARLDLQEVFLDADDGGGCFATGD